MTAVRGLAGVLLAACCATGAAQSEDASSDDADRKAIGVAYATWAAAANEKDMSRWVPFLAPDALFLPPNHVALRDEGAIRAFYSKLFTDPQFSLTCKQERVEVSVSRDMAWSTGTCEATFTGPNGQRASDSSKWVKVWKKQSDGQWKCAVNSWSSMRSGGQ
jgi:uncharacterized protein (TIGR02246 family)